MTLPMEPLLHPITRDVLFSHNELASPDTDEVMLAKGFADELVRLRVLFGMPMFVNSCCRTQSHNATVDGHPRSLHLMSNPVHPINGCAAIDVRIDSGAFRTRQLTKMALNLGWSVGLAKTFIHLDRRDFAGLEPGAFGY